MVDNLKLQPWELVHDMIPVPNAVATLEALAVYQLAFTSTADQDEPAMKSQVTSPADGGGGARGRS